MANISQVVLSLAERLLGFGRSSGGLGLFGHLALPWSVLVACHTSSYQLFRSKRRNKFLRSHKKYMSLTCLAQLWELRQ